MIFSIRRDWPALLLLAAMFVVAAVAWPSMPERLPVHWGITGEPDRWGSKPEGLLILPVTAAAMWALMVVLPRFDPGRANYAAFAGVYTIIRTVTVAFLAVLYAATIASAFGVDVAIDRVAWVGTGLLFVLLGGLFGKLRPSWFVGIRTPWTLSSKLAWTRTHRVGGFSFIALGLAILVAGWFSSVAAFAVLMLGSLANLCFVFIYSYRVWARDPDRQPPAGTLPVDGKDA